MAYSCVYPSGYTLTTEEQARYPVGKRFTSLALWEAQNLSLTEDEICEIIPGDESYNWQSSPDTSPVEINGWTLNSYALEITTIGEARPFGALPYLMSISSDVHAVHNRVSGSVIDGISVETTSETHYPILFGEYRNSMTVKNCTVRGGYSGIYGGSYSYSLSVINCIAIGAQRGGIELTANSNGDDYIVNCTAYDNVKSGYAYRGGITAGGGSGTIHVKNCISMDNGNDDFYSGSHTPEYCISSDATADGTGCLANQSLSSLDFENTTSGSEDLRIGADSVAIGAGIGPGADSDIPVEDIDGDTRSGSTTDIGADLYASAGSTYQRDASWQIAAEASMSLAWRLLSDVAQDSRWRILTENTIDAAWHDLAEINKDLSWMLFNKSDKTLSWRLFNAMATNVVWQNAIAALKGIAWCVLNAARHETAWAILNQSQTLKPITWRVLADASMATSWRIFGSAMKDARWMVKDEAILETAWQIVVAGIFSQAISWRTFNASEQNAAWRVLAWSFADSAWRVFNTSERGTAWRSLTLFSDDIVWRIIHDSVSGVAWRLFNVKDHQLGWHILEQMAADSAWIMFNASEKDVRWHILAAEVPEPIATFILNQRAIFAFNLNDQSIITFDFNLQ